MRPWFVPDQFEELLVCRMAKFSDAERDQQDRGAAESPIPP